MLQTESSGCCDYVRRLICWDGVNDDDKEFQLKAYTMTLCLTPLISAFFFGFNMVLKGVDVGMLTLEEAPVGLLAPAVLVQYSTSRTSMSRNLIGSTMALGFGELFFLFILVALEV